MFEEHQTIPRYLRVIGTLLSSTMLVMLDSGVLLVFNVFSGVERNPAVSRLCLKSHGIVPP